MDIQIEPQAVKTPRRTPEQLKYHRERQKTYVAKNREAVNRRQRKWHSDPEIRQKRREYDKAHRVERLLGEARKRARAKGLPMTLTVDDIVIPDRCPVLGIPLVFDGDRPNWPSLDRLNGPLGYVPGNVFVISHRANNLKNDATVTEVEAVLRYMLERL
jgi:hypothetical protein